MMSSPQATGLSMKIMIRFIFRACRLKACFRTFQCEWIIDLVDVCSEKQKRHSICLYGQISQGRDIFWQVWFACKRLFHDSGIIVPFVLFEILIYNYTYLIF